MTESAITRRRLTFLASCAAFAGGSTGSAKAQGALVATPNVATMPGSKMKIWPGKALGLADSWDEFWVESPGSPEWSEATEPQFVEGGSGEDLLKLDAAEARRKVDSTLMAADTGSSDIKAIMAAKGGPVLKKYQDLIRTLDQTKLSPEAELRSRLPVGEKWKP